MPIPDFVLALRSHVGHELLWMPGVSAVVVHEDGRLLLGRRADNGLWAVVSGILEPGEQPALAAVREVLEETGIDAVVEGLAAVSSNPETVRYENGDRAQYLDLTFLCRAVGTGDPRVADDESTWLRHLPVGLSRRVACGTRIGCRVLLQMRPPLQPAIRLYCVVGPRQQTCCPGY